MRGELSAFYLFTRYFAGVYDEAVYKLHVRHFEREDGNGCIVVDSHVFGHRENESRFSHGRTGGNDDEVGILPARRHFIEVGKSRLQTAQTVFSVRGYFENMQGFVDDGIYLGNIFLYISLGNFKKLPFRLLHQIVYVVRFFVSFGLYFTGEPY